MYRSVGLIAFAAGFLALSQGAAAQGAADRVMVRQVVVSYGDLDLNSTSGAAALGARIEAAAIQACGGRPQFQTHYRDTGPYITSRFEACRSAAVGRAMAEVNARRGGRSIASSRE